MCSQVSRSAPLVASCGMSARVGALPRALSARARCGLNRSVLQPLELLRADGSERPLDQPPLLIVGAPRSGSTLLYQLLVGRYDVTYLANRHCTFFGAPSWVERLAGRRASPPDDYSSRHGLTEGAWGPAECGPFWYRFFRKSPQFVPLVAAEPDDLRRLRAACRALADAGARPVVFKNLLCALRLEPIAAALPEARFVVITRELEAHARSILAARQRANGEVRSWFSAEPPGWERLRKLEPVEQVLGQIDAIHATIEKSRAELGAGRFIGVRYEDLIADPRRSLETIALYADDHGIRLEPRRDVPRDFPPQPAAPLEPELEEALAGALERRDATLADRVERSGTAT